MQGYAPDYRDRYGRFYEDARGPRRGFHSRPGWGNDRWYRRATRYDAFGPEGHQGAEPGFGYGIAGSHGWAGSRYGQEFDSARGRPMSGSAPRNDQRSLHNRLDADSIRAADIMTANPEAVTPETSLAQAARRMRDLDVGVMPVVDSEDGYHLEGIVTDRDIAIRAAAEEKDMKKTSVREIMSVHPQTVGENDHVRDVFTVMKRARVRRVPVVAADGRLVGIIAQADLAVNYAGLDLQRETEVEEVIERISEPARPRWGREGSPPDDRGRPGRRFRPEFDLDLPDRVRTGWRTLRREARDLMGRGYDRGWR